MCMLICFALKSIEMNNIIEEFMKKQKLHPLHLAIFGTLKFLPTCSFHFIVQKF